MKALNLDKLTYINNRKQRLQNEVFDIEDKILELRHRIIKEGKKPFFLTKIKGYELAVKKRNIIINQLEYERKEIKFQKHYSNERLKRQELFVSIIKKLIVKETGESRAKEIFTLAHDLARDAPLNLEKTDETTTFNSS